MSKDLEKAIEYIQLVINDLRDFGDESLAEILEEIIEVITSPDWIS